MQKTPESLLLSRFYNPPVRDPEPYVKLWALLWFSEAPKKPAHGERGSQNLGYTDMTQEALLYPNMSGFL